MSISEDLREIRGLLQQVHRRDQEIAVECMDRITRAVEAMERALEETHEATKYWAGLVPPDGFRASVDAALRLARGESEGGK